MKHLLFVIALAGFLSAATSSKTLAQFDIGARIGANISNYQFSTTPTNTTTSASTGILGGLQIDYWFNTMWAFNAQLLYIQKGSKFTSVATDQGPSSSGTVSANYVEIPLTAKLRFGDDGTVRVYATAGPTIGFLLSANANSSLSGGSSRPCTPIVRQSSDVKDQFTSTDFGILGGVGLDILVSNSMTIFGEAAYRFGFANINNTTGSTDTENTRDIRLSAGIVWTLSK